MAKLRLVRWQAFSADEGAIGTRINLRNLVPARRPNQERDSKKPFSTTTLVVAVLLHAGVAALLISAATQKPVIEKEPAPMMVSLVAAPQPAPEPEIVPLVPEPPKPQPVIKKLKPTPEPQVKPVPQPQPEVQATPPAPPAAEPVPAAPVEAKAPEIVEEPEPLPEPEPVVEPPRFGVAYLNNPEPAYPSLSRRMGEEGRVILRVLVTAKGDAGSVEVETGSGSNRLDQAALNSVKKWRFIPARRNNEAISAYVLVPINFSLDS
jgi:protein TonB